MLRHLAIALTLGSTLLVGPRMMSPVVDAEGPHLPRDFAKRGQTGHRDASRPTSLPDSVLHYAPNGNFDENGEFQPVKFGFNVADIADPLRLKAVPDGVQVLVWIGQCEGVTDKFLATVKPFLGDRKVFGYYLMDDPDPRSRLGAGPPCPPERLKEEADWLHAHVPGTKTVIVLMNLSDARTPLYKDSYNPGNSHIDLFGLCAYPCRTEFGGCDPALIPRYIAASDLAGIPRAQVMPIYQAFGGGRWRDDEDGRYIMPSAAEEVEIIKQWRTFVPNPVIDMAYSWGMQSDDISLHDTPDLKVVFSIYNKLTSPRRQAVD